MTSMALYVHHIIKQRRTALAALDHLTKLTLAYVLAEVRIMAKSAGFDDDPDGDADDARENIVFPNIPNRPFSTASEQLQKKYAHAQQFGFPKNYTRINANKFGDTLQNFVNNPANEQMVGMYRGQPAIHYLNRETGMNVVTKINGEFWTNFILGPEQLSYWPSIKARK